MNLTILLIRQDLKTSEDILNKSSVLEKFNLGLPDGDSGSTVKAALYFERRPQRLPPWATFFANLLDTKQVPTVTASPAVLIVPVEDRIFAIIFSRGQSLLGSGVSDPTFGLRVALNSINPEMMRSYDKRRFDALFRQTREQASKETSLESFGIDAERDLVRAVSGKPQELSLGSSMTGGTSLRVSAKITPRQLVHYLRRLSRKSQQKQYLNEYPWLGRIEEVLDDEIKKTLDSYLGDRIAEGTRGLWLAIPEIIDWSDIAGFKFVLPSRCNLVFQDIDLAHLSKALGGKRSITVDFLKNQKVEMLDTEDNVAKRWKIYDCINSELRLGDSEYYALSSGCWYRIDSDLLVEVDREVNRLTTPEFDLPEFDDRSELAYNERVALAQPNLFCCLDQQNIMFGGGLNRFELCDLLTSDGDLVHVKRYGGSSVLSHLFAQGLTSADLLMNRPTFRKNADKLADSKDFPLPQGKKFVDKIRRRVVYAVVGGPANTKSPELPLFARINLRNAIRRLRSFDWEVQLVFVPESEILQKSVRKRKSKR